MEVKNSTQWVAISESDLSADALTSWVTRGECGAVVTFCGTARTSSSTGHEIVLLEYETSEPLALARLSDVALAAKRQWPDVGAIAIHHRVGRVLIGQPAVVVAVSSPHRREAFDAARFCIDVVKSTVPMWKRETWEGGSAWSNDTHDIVDVDDVGLREGTVQGTAS